MAEDIFEGLSPEDREKIRGLAREITFEKEAVVFREGEASNAVFLIVNGTVTLYKTDRGAKVTYANLKPGEFFGELEAIQDKKNRGLTAQCTSSCIFLEISKLNFDNLIKVNPFISLKIMRSMQRKSRPLESPVAPSENKAESPPPAPTAQLITLFSPGNHVGKSTLAVNLAGGLSGLLKKKVCLLDLDLQFGDISFYLFPNPPKGKTRTIGDLVQEKEVDWELLKKHLQTHPESGVQLLAGPAEPEQSELVDSPKVAAIIPILRQNFDFIIVDTHSYLSDVNITLFDQSEKVFLVMTPDKILLRNVGNTLALLKQLYGENFPQKVGLVVNRMGAPHSLSEEFLEKNLPLKPQFLLPNDPDLFQQSVDGHLLSLMPNLHSVVIRLKEMVCAIGGVDPAPFVKVNVFDRIKGFLGF